MKVRLTPLGKIMVLLLILLVLSGFKLMVKMSYDSSAADKGNDSKALAMTGHINNNLIKISRTNDLNTYNQNILKNLHVTINFNPYAAIIDRAYYQALEIIAEVAKTAEYQAIQIEGNTADVSKSGNTEYDKKLSLERANAVANYLTGNGIPHEKMVIIGNGTDKPLGDNSTKDGQAQNRRVDISFILSEEGGEYK